MTTILPLPSIPIGTEPRPKRWTRDEFYGLARQGFFYGQRVLLLDGEIIEMPPMGNWHSLVLGFVEQSLLKIFPIDRFWVRGQRPLDLPDGSEPEPDVSVVAGGPADYPAHPTSALLVVEVADSSLRLDRLKANAYAAAAVGEYWIVDIRGHAVEVCRKPTAAPGEKFGHKYDHVEIVRPGQTIVPLAAPDAVIQVADLLPKQPIPNPDA